MKGGMSLARAAVGLLAVFLLLASLSAAQPDDALNAPTYDVSNRWRYTVEGEVAGLAGFNDSAGSVGIRGISDARVTSIEGSRTTLSWTSDFSLEGELSTTVEQTDVVATLAGTVGVSQVESYETPYFMPLEVQASADFELSVTAFVLTIDYSASFEMLLSNTPRDSFPAYPLTVGERVVDVPTHLESDFTFSFGGSQVDNTSTIDAESVLRLNITGGHDVKVPAGTFKALRVETETVNGTAALPFLILFQGTRQVAFYSNEVGNAVLFQFFSGDVEMGNATLESYSYSLPSETPFWQQPAFLGGILVIPAALLLYFFWRERRKGL